MQSIMTITLLLSSFLDIHNNVNLIIFFAVIFSFSATTQIIATDALLYKSVHEEQRATGNAIKTSSGLLGVMLGGGGGLVIYSYFDWGVSLSVMSFLCVVAFVQILFFKEESFEKRKSDEKITLKSYYSFLSKKDKGWLLLLATYPAPLGSAFGLTTPILVDIGWELHKIGYTVYVLAYSVGILASFSAPWLINRFGYKKVIIITIFGQSISLLSLLLPLNGFDSFYTVAFITSLVFLFYTPCITVFTTLMMNQITDKSHAGSQYAIQHSLTMISAVLSAGFSVFLASKFGYSSVIIFFSLSGLLIMFLASRLSGVFVLKEK